VAGIKGAVGGRRPDGRQGNGMKAGER